MLSTGTFIERFGYYNGGLTSFKHPATDQVIVAGRDFHSRRALCDKYFDAYRVIDFKFKNQSWAVIARTILENVCAALPQSQYPPDCISTLDDFPIRAYHMCVAGAKQWASDGRDYTSVDIRRCYTCIMKDNIEPYHVFNVFDTVQPYDAVVASHLLPGE